MSFLGPVRISQLRACYTCRVLRTEKQFEETGCPNCRVNDTRRARYTANFQGMVSILDPSKSWVSKWLGHTTPGYYALAVPKAPPVGESYADEIHYDEDHEQLSSQPSARPQIKKITKSEGNESDDDDLYLNQSTKAFVHDDDDDDDVVNFAIS